MTEPSHLLRGLPSSTSRQKVVSKPAPREITCTAVSHAENTLGA